MNDLSQTLVDIARNGAARAVKLQRMADSFTDLRLLQASGEFQFRFEELGLELECSGFSCGSFNGTAQVTYWNDEDGLEWFVGDILLDCSKWTGEGWDARTIKLERDHKLYLDIWGVLTDGAFRDSVEARVMAAL